MVADSEKRVAAEDHKSVKRHLEHEEETGVEGGLFEVADVHWVGHRHDYQANPAEEPIFGFPQDVVKAAGKLFCHVNY
jgi:hypothetical protein